MDGKSTNENQSIGMAAMNADGAIVLQLRATGPEGELGDAQLVYTPTHPQYQEVLKHLGGLRPGERKLVSPWPEKE
jgi:hypothetical protein